MDVETILNLAFENTGAYLSDLEQVRGLIQEVSAKTKSIDDMFHLLETKMEESEVSLRTDIRILLNEIRHLSKKR